MKHFNLIGVLHPNAGLSHTLSSRQVAPSSQDNSTAGCLLFTEKCSWTVALFYLYISSFISTKLEEAWPVCGCPSRQWFCVKASYQRQIDNFWLILGTLKIPWGGDFRFMGVGGGGVLGRMDLFALPFTALCLELFYFPHLLEMFILNKPFIYTYNLSRFTCLGVL